MDDVGRHRDSWAQNVIQFDRGDFGIEQISIQITMIGNKKCRAVHRRSMNSMADLFDNSAQPSFIAFACEPCPPMLWSDIGCVVEQCHELDRKSTRLNSSHVAISYAVFCLKKKKK